MWLIFIKKQVNCENISKSVKIAQISKKLPNMLKYKKQNFKF